MPNQPDPTPRQISPIACIHAMLSAAATTSLVGIIYAEANTNFEAYHGVPALLAAVAAITGIGALIRNAQDRVTHRQEASEQRVSALIDRMDKRLNEQRQEDYATAFVAGASSGRHLSSVRQG